jgi:hypothetical protein
VDAKQAPRRDTGGQQTSAGSGTSGTTVADNAVKGPQCTWCHGPLPCGRRRFCCDDHRRRGQKAERKTDDADHAEYVKRLVEAQGKRAGADLPMFALFAEAVDFARARLQDAADQLVAQGYSYGDIGRALGITRQGARQRFGRQQAVVTGPGESGAVG